MRGRKRRQADLSTAEKSGDAEQTAAALNEDAGTTTDGPDENQKVPTESIKSPVEDAHDTTDAEATEEAIAAKKPPEQAESGQAKAGTVDLDALGRELEKSLGAKPDEAPIAAPPPPDMNATPEDILGVPTQRVTIDLADEKRSEPEPEHHAGAGAESIKGGGGPPPMEEYEERAQMAKEVLRATSDQPRSARRQPKPDGESSDAGDAEDDEPPGHEDNVRFSEDLTFSSRSSRKRRKLFGR
ncbi:MAG: hypothetical protein ACLP6E_13455 [Acidimicrobiales bacterium]